ncbi:MAG: DUF756 domain-containing protein, partial [Pedobacter sp.]
PFTMITSESFKGVKGKVWAYAVKAGDKLSEKINIEDFDNGVYDFRITGPNGFYRHFTGNKQNPQIVIKAMPEQSGLVSKKLTGNLIFSIENRSSSAVSIQIIDNKYKTATRTVLLKPKATSNLVSNLSKNGNWYDLSIINIGNSIFKHRYSGKIETGQITTSDPYMGNA